MTTRFRGLVLFLAIVWSIAVAFLLLENSSQELLDWALRSGTIPAEIGMPRASAEAVAKCAAAIQPSEQQALDVEALRQVRFIAWKMGYGFGSTIALGQAGAIDGGQRETSLDLIKPMSESLRVPVPSPPALVRSVTALPDYGQSIEDDASCTAAILDNRYGSRVGHLYKLGAVIGFAVVYRVVCPQCGVLFAPQIHHYGEGAGLPEKTWQAFTQLPPEDPSLDARQQTSHGVGGANRAFSFKQNSSERPPIAVQGVSQCYDIMTARVSDRSESLRLHRQT